MATLEPQLHEVMVAGPARGKAEAGLVRLPTALVASCSHSLAPSLYDAAAQEPVITRAHLEQS